MARRRKRAFKRRGRPRFPLAALVLILAVLSQTGRTPRLYAAWTGKLEVVELLNRADIEARSKVDAAPHRCERTRDVWFYL